MKTKSIIFTAALLLFGVYPASIVAQDGLQIIEKLERVTKEKEPQWKLDRKLPTENIFVLRWSSGEARVFMSITVVNSTDKAGQIYEDSVARSNEKLGTKGSAVPGLGAASQLWTGYDNIGSAQLQFQLGKVHVLLFAPSEDVAKRFASYVADLLPPAKTPKAANSPQDWKEYSSAEGRFSVLFPGDPVEETQLIELAPGVQLKLHIHKLMTLAECSVMYLDYPMPVDDPAVAKEILDKGVEGAVASVKSELLELKEITFAGHPGRYMKERMPSGEIMRVKMLLVGARMYQIAVTTPREDGASAKLVKGYETIADKFLNSFKLKGGNKSAQAPKEFQNLSDRQLRPPSSF